jgi:hypothetical protein
MNFSNNYDRDPNTRFLINNDEKGLKDYNFKIEVYSDIKKLKRDVQNIKELLQKLEEKIDVKKI